jgi:hypothetical protein
MYHDSSAMVRFCLARARDCRRNAEHATDPFVERSWREMEGHWFFLARSYDNERRAEPTGPDLEHIRSGA